MIMATEAIENIIIETTSGRVSGRKRATVYGDEFFCFDGIPYAEPPLNELRFKAPKPIAKWQGVRDCTQIANKCLQWNRYAQEVQGSEDCLYLNVYVKKFNTRPRLPVMVYLHGGGFNTGDATRLSWGPDYFMLKDVVLITIGYRLGIFGFAHFFDKSLEVAGNAGLKDIILALKWIKENCENFNGDENNITLFGHSSGSAAAHLLMLSPSASGLFHKTILLAGFSMDMPQIPNLQYRLAKHLGFNGSEGNEKDMCNYLSQVEGKQLVGFDIWTQEEKDNGNMYPFVPTIETFRDENSIIMDDPVKLQRQTWSNVIPLMMGCPSNDALLLYKHFTTNAVVYEKFNKNPETLLPRNLQSLEDHKLKLELAENFRDLHFGGKELKIENYQCAIELMSYHNYHAQHRILKSRLQNSPAPTYIYRFDFDSPFFNLYRLKHCGPDVQGAGHVDELSYIFFMPGSYKLDTNTPEYKCIELMIESFYSFAKSSNPTNAKIQPAYWEPVKRNGLPKCLNINYESTTIITQPEYQKCCIRDQLYSKANITLY